MDCRNEGGAAHVTKTSQNGGKVHGTLYLWRSAASWSPTSMTDQPGRLLATALGFAGCSMPSDDRALHAFRSWMDSYDLHRTREED